MKNLVNRYLYAVTRRLPEAIRADVERELRSNIEDMLPENPAEEDIERVLTELGSPAKLAVRYNPRPRYLIPPEYFDDYTMVLRVVAVTLAALLAALAVFKIIFGDTGGSIVETVSGIIASFLGGAWNGIVHAFFWVTVVFFIVGFVEGRKEAKPWSPRELPEVPATAKVQLKRSDTVAGAVFTVLFSVIFLIGTLREPQFIAWYETGAPVVPLFSPQVVTQFLPLFVFMLLLMLFVSAMKLVKGRWTPAVAVSQCIYSVLNVVVDLTFINHQDVFTDAFITRFAEKVLVTAEAMRGYFRIAITVITVLTVIGAISEVIQAIVRTAKSYK